MKGHPSYQFTLRYQLLGKAEVCAVRQLPNNCKETACTDGGLIFDNGDALRLNEKFKITCGGCKTMLKHMSPNWNY